jgi:hypothetical protein
MKYITKFRSLWTRPCHRRRFIDFIANDTPQKFRSTYYTAQSNYSTVKEKDPRRVCLCGFRYYAEWDLHTAATGAQGPARQAAMQAGVETGPPSTATSTKRRERSRRETQLLLAILLLFLKYCIKLIFHSLANVVYCFIIKIVLAS